MTDSQTLFAKDAGIVDIISNINKGKKKNKWIRIMIIAKIYTISDERYTSASVIYFKK
jgi:hypothetical protein